MKSKVAIIGAGMSGLLLARKLIKSNIDVTVYDQKHKLGHPVRASSILSVNGLSALGIDYTKIPANELRGAIIYAGGKKLNIMSKKVMAYSMDRHELNEMLKEECIDAGGKIVTGKRIEAKDLDALASKYIIVGADGFNSEVARHYGFLGNARHVLTYRAEYTADLEDTRMVELFFDKRISPGFFGWIAPEPKGIVEVGVGIEAGHGNSKAAYDRLTKVDRVSEFIAGATLRDSGASVIPIGLRKKFADNEKEVVLVGDAAGQVKATTGGGIVFGGIGALIAADVIKKHIEAGTSLCEYERLWNERHLLDMNLHRAVRRVYSALDTKQIASLIGLMKAMKVDRFLEEYGDMDRPSVVLKRFFLRGFAR